VHRLLAQWVSERVGTSENELVNMSHVHHSGEALPQSEIRAIAVSLTVGTRGSADLPSTDTRTPDALRVRVQRNRRASIRAA
jgi:hypothetical protein